MNSTVEFQNNEDLIFFGNVNASISHELKNILAIISEAAGLLKDLIEMARKENKFELEMMESCSKDIVEEISRGFAAIKKMNSFSHSVDEPVKRVNLVELVNLMIDLAGFLSFASKVRFYSAEESGPHVLTCPFRLQSLLYQSLVFGFQTVGPDGEILLSITPEESGSVRITFAGLGKNGARMFPVDKTEQLAESIGAEIRLTDDSEAVDILVPKDIKSRR
jgi:hypothetical protein